MQSLWIKWILFIAGLSLLAGCSSDIFNPPKEPVIRELTLSAYEVNPGDTISVAVDVEDEKDAVLSYEWEVSGGRLIPPTDSPEVLWIMPVSGGDYTIRVKVTNQDDKSADKRATATVRSFENPIVQIESPETDDFFVQNETITIQANASHENGISSVNFYINDELQRTMTYQSGSRYSTDVTLQSWVGATELKVEAVARTTRTVGCDSVTIYVEGIVLGKE